MSTQFRQLLDLINSAAATLEKNCSVNGTRIPDPHEPFQPKSEAFRTDPVAENAANIIGAAALQLASLQWDCSALRLCLDTHVTEVLREAGPEGMHVKDIEAKNGIDASKLAQCLRLLSIQHVYREVKPDVFANTRLSSLLDTSKPSRDIIAEYVQVFTLTNDMESDASHIPKHKHDNTNGFPAFASFLLDEYFKASAYVLENAIDPKTRKSGNPADAPFARPEVYEKSMWEFYGQPEQKFKEHRFNIGMKGLLSMLPDNSIALEAFDWRSLPKGALVVDVGGGVGMIPMLISREHSHFRFVIQDRPSVVENGIQIWKQEVPSALQSGRVKFEAHDFFTTQPHTDASLFLLKHILHNWADDYSLTILKHLRAAATPTTRIVCIDTIVPYACRGSSNAAGGIPGAAIVEAPEPLIANWGLVSGSAFYLDSIMMTVCNSLERTIGQFDELFREAGWKIVTVRHGGTTRPFALAAIEAVPIEYKRKQLRSHL